MAPGGHACAEVWLQGLGASRSIEEGQFRFPSEAGASDVLAACNSAEIDTSHPDWPGFDLPAVDTSECDSGSWTVWAFYGEVLPPPPIVPEAPNGSYVFEICWLAGPNPGTYYFDFLASPNSFWRDPYSLVYATEFHRLFVCVGNNYGDIDENGTPNVFDIFCILDLIAGDPPASPNCTFDNADIEPCYGNGALNVFDIFAVLDTIRGVDACCKTW